VSPSTLRPMWSPPARMPLIPVPTLALAALDIKHLFDAPQKMSYPSATTESHEHSIEL
jgi:hypothetical protein